MLRLVFAIFLFALVHAQTQIDPPTNTKIRWADVRPTGFKVTWSGPANAHMYNVNLYEKYSKIPMREYENVTDEYLVIRDLSLYTVYGVQVQCVGKDGSLSKFGRPGRTQTFGRPMTTTTTTVAPSQPTPIGECGIGKFTCESNVTECIDESWWCDKKKDCQDGSDEKDCPGSCEVILDFHSAGNFSCSRFNSPRSACFFQCNGDFLRKGPWYTMCVQRKWSRDIPTCVLKAPKNVRVVNDGTRQDTIEIEFEGILSAEDYVIESVTDVATGQAVPTASFEYDFVLDNLFMGFVTGLESRKQYRISIAALDSDNVRGVGSRPVVGRTAQENDRAKEEATTQRMVTRF